MTRVLGVVRRALDTLYLIGGYIGALFLLTILLLISAQMVARWTGITIPGASSYAGYAMAGASFMAFAYALNTGSHIRVTLGLVALGRWRRWGEVWCLLIGALVATYILRYAYNAVYWSRRLGDMSQGQDATPLWIPQTVMVIGSALLAICLWDNLIRMVFTGQSATEGEAEETARTE
jgi:TRAP-type C4-dicarboxylate transport system permease small subunit